MNCLLNLNFLLLMCCYTFHRPRLSPFRSRSPSYVKASSLQVQVTPPRTTHYSAATTIIIANSIDAPTATKLESFQPAKSLDFFRNIDEKKFKWVNKAEIHPGGVTCGFLKAPLLWPKGTSGWPAEGEDDAYPIVDVCKCSVVRVSCRVHYLSIATNRKDYYPSVFAQTCVSSLQRCSQLHEETLLYMKEDQAHYLLLFMALVKVLATPQTHTTSLELIK